MTFKTILVSAFVFAILWGAGLIPIGAKKKEVKVEPGSTLGMAKGVLQILFYLPLWILGFTIKKPKGRYNAAWATGLEKRGLLNGRNTGLTFSGHPKERMARKVMYENIMVNGGVGSGKSSQVVKTSIALLDDCSICVTDPSGEIFVDTISRKIGQGYRVKMFNLINPSYSDTINHIQHLRTASDCYNYMDIVMHAHFKESVINGANKIFYIGARDLGALLLSILIRAPKCYQNLKNLYHLVVNISGNGKRLMGFIHSYATAEQMAEWISFLNNEPKMRASIVTNAKEMLHFDPLIYQLTASDSFGDLDDFRKEKTIWYIIAHESDFASSMKGPSLAMELTFLLQNLKKMPMEDDLDVVLMLDEFPVIASRIGSERTQTAATTLRKRRVSMTMICQDARSQLSGILSPYAFQTLMSNTTTKYYLKPRSMVVAREISDMAGRTTIVKDDGSEEVVPLITPEQILSSNDGYLFLDEHTIRIEKHYPYHETRPYTQYLELPPFHFPKSDLEKDIPLIDLDVLNASLEDQS